MGPSLCYQKEKTFSFICVVVEVCCFKIIQLIKFQFHSIRKFAPLKSLQCITFGQLLVTTLFEMMMPKAVDARKGNGRLLDLLVSMSLSGDKSQMLGYLKPLSVRPCTTAILSTAPCFFSRKVRKHERKSSKKANACMVHSTLWSKIGNGK